MPMATFFSEWYYVPSCTFDTFKKWNWFQFWWPWICQSFIMSFVTYRGRSECPV